jgi:hypothetical protein
MTTMAKQAPEQLPPKIQGKMRLFQHLLMSYVDFNQAGAIAGYILKEDLHARLPESGFALEGLNCGMIVAYWRPFSSNDRRARRRLPDLPASLLRILTMDERQLHEIVVSDRNRRLAHSDSDEWDPNLAVMRVQSSNILLLVFNPVHAPLNREATVGFRSMAEKLREVCFERRMSMEPELIQYFPVIEYSSEQLRRAAEEAGLPQLPDLGNET